MESQVAVSHSVRFLSQQKETKADFQQTGLCLLAHPVQGSLSLGKLRGPPREKAGCDPLQGEVSGLGKKKSLWPKGPVYLFCSVSFLRLFAQGDTDDLGRQAVPTDLPFWADQ